jgi:hypothetical protein
VKIEIFREEVARRGAFWPLFRIPPFPAKWPAKLKNAGIPDLLNRDPMTKDIHSTLETGKPRASNTKDWDQLSKRFICGCKEKGIPLKSGKLVPLR